MNIFIEALIVGLITAIVGFILSTLLMYTNKNFELKKYSFWFQVLLSFFLTGVAVHLVCEYTGVNKLYCKSGNACKK